MLLNLQNLQQPSTTLVDCLSNPSKPLQPFPHPERRCKRPLNPYSILGKLLHNPVWVGDTSRSEPLIGVGGLWVGFTAQGLGFKVQGLGFWA